VEKGFQLEPMVAAACDEVVRVRVGLGANAVVMGARGWIECARCVDWGMRCWSV
jgi:hypothetical protein